MRHRAGHDAQAAQLQENPCSNGSVAISPNYGGVIATTGDESTAIGIYAVKTTQGGSVDYLVLNFTWNCPGPPTDTGEFDSDTMIVDSVRYTGYPAGPQAYPAAPGYAVPNPGVEYLAPGAPPPPQQEIIIATPGPGYTWAGGYWHWQNGWIWIPGQWILPPRPGMRWFGPHWEPHHDGDRYRMEHGGWR